MPELSGQQFAQHPLFHGTAHEIQGETIVPGKQFGQSSFRHGGRGPRGRAHSESAFATTSEEAAWHFADTSANKVEGRARVHEVEPHPEMEPGLWNREHRTFGRRNRADPAVGRYADKWQEWAAPSLRLTGRTIDTKPGHQGSFPTVNWNQFKAPSVYGDANHLAPDEVANGGAANSKQYAEADWENYNRRHGHPVGNRELDGPRPAPDPWQGRLL